MNNILFLACIAFAALVSGCGHSQINYTPDNHPGMDTHQAASIIEQGFYEDFSQQKPQSAMVTPDFIALSNGTVSRGFTTGTATAYGGVVTGLGSTFIKTEDINQRIYFRSLGTPIVLKRNGRDNRYAVTIRMAEGSTARNVYFRSEARAKEFADALVFISSSSARGDLGSAQPERPSAATAQSSKDQRIRQLQQQNLNYAEYQRRYNSIMSE